jgi:excisionase family DNA binding protein
MAIDREMKLLTASDVADLCEVDLKTIHNWVERGCIPHFRTPGRHLRFRAVDIVNFLREWGYAIPRRFYSQIANTVMVASSGDLATVVQKSLGSSASVISVVDMVDAVIRIGTEPISAIIVDSALGEKDQSTVELALNSIKRNFENVVQVIIGDDRSNLSGSTSAVVVAKGDSKQLRAALSGEPKEEEAEQPQQAAPVAQPKPVGRRPGRPRKQE